MFKRRLWLRALGGLVVVGLLVGAGAGGFRLGWWQGYQAAQAAEDAEEPGLVPGWPMHGRGSWMPHRFSRFPGVRFSFFGPGSLVRVGLLIGLLFLVVGLFRSCAWRSAGHMAHKHWSHPPHAPCSPHGHRFEGKFDSGEEPVPEAGDKDEE